MSAHIQRDALPPQRVGTVPRDLTVFERVMLALVSLGAVLLGVSLLTPGSLTAWTTWWTAPILTYGLVLVGGVGYFVSAHAGTSPGIKHDGVMFGSVTNRGAGAWMAGIAFTTFYVMLYWHPAALEGAIRLLDPVAWVLYKGPSSQWFLYGFLYTAAVLVFGVRMLMKYRHSRYQILRTLSVMFFQLAFAFLIPHLLKALNQPEFYFTYFWPLKPEYLLPWTWTADGVAGQGAAVSGLTVGRAMLLWSAMMSVVAVPALTYLFGKRWYCSWVCGCGALAETLGDPYRQLSDKSESAWRVERWMVHGVLVIITLFTALLWVNAATGNAIFGDGGSHVFNKTYGFFIGATFSGVVGVGFYPLLGSRVWCRFGCPQAAILGLFQRFFSRFRITTNGSQCISCGNCSTYCEMGIDVRAYAQRGENIVRASCVGCGVCAEVCPRGVLKLENGPFDDRFRNANRPLAAVADALRGRPQP